MPPKQEDKVIQPHTHNGDSLENTDSASSTPSESQGPKRKRKKVVIACVYCRRSHMICDEKRPCTRCIKRNIGHLCHDEPVSQRQKKKLDGKTENTPEPAGQPQKQRHMPEQQQPQPLQQVQQHQVPITNDSFTSTSNNHNTNKHIFDIPTNLKQNLGGFDLSDSRSRPSALSNQITPLTSSKNSTNDLLNFGAQPFFISEHAGSEFSSLNEFLSMLDDPELMGADASSLNNNGSDPNMVFSTPTLGNVNTNHQIQPQQSQQQGTGISASHSLMNLSLTNLSALNSPNLQAGVFNFNQQHQQQLQQQQLQQQPPPQQQQQHQNQHQQQQQLQLQNQGLSNNTNLPTLYEQQQTQQLQSLQPAHPPSQHHISDSARDKFFLTAADPSTEISPEERLKQVINAKLEAGLLQPYNYAKGYARLQVYMDNYMNHSSKQRILKPLSIFRPAFRAIARTLKDVDLILVEENFERMLLDYDRVFTSMAIPACLWRRTGEIYRGNKEFASLVEVSADDLRDGKLAIYELMSEESAVNFWEKYGAIAFDKGQKAVLTSCNLRTKDGRRRKTCCFSFTIRRDRYNIPSCIVGNFIPINP